MRSTTQPARAEPAPEGLRERKKRLTREAIAAAATRLFAERGFDNVTVAEIADEANVSVKTLFSYVGTKEELLLNGQPAVLEDIVRAVRNRRLGQTPLVAAAQALLTAASDPDPARSLEGFRQLIISGPAARSRVRALWDETESRLADALAVRGDGPAGPASRRLVAAQIMVLVRTVTSDEVSDLVIKSADTDKARREALSQWIRDAAGILARGLQSAPR